MKIVATYDTVTKELVVTKDGETVPDVYAVDMGRSWDDDSKYRCDLMQVTENEADKTVTVTRLCASEDPKLSPSAVAGFSVASVGHPAVSAMAKVFSGR